MGAKFYQKEAVHFYVLRHRDFGIIQQLSYPRLTNGLSN